MGQRQPARFAALCGSALVVLGAASVLLTGCEVEKRRIGPSEPGSPPIGQGDMRARIYDTNRFEQAQGGRLFRWAGCDGCHGEAAPGYANLTDTAWRRGGSTVDIYRAIADGAPGMPPYAARLTPQQTWQVAGYVSGLHRMKANQRVRSSNAQAGEPSGATWAGPLS